MIMRWAATPIHFIDFEGSAASGILEFGVVTLQGGGIAATHTRLCRATGPVAADDTKVHGLSADGPAYMMTRPEANHISMKAASARCSRAAGP